MATRKQGDLAITVNTHDRSFPSAVQSAALGEISARPGSGFIDEASHPEAHRDTLLPQLLLFAPEFGVVRKRQEFVQKGRWVARIVNAAAGGGIREVGPCD